MGSPGLWVAVIGATFTTRARFWRVVRDPGARFFGFSPVWPICEASGLIDRRSLRPETGAKFARAQQTKPLVAAAAIGGVGGGMPATPGV